MLDDGELRALLERSGLGFSGDEISFIIAEVPKEQGQVSFATFQPLCFDLMVERIARELRDEQRQKDVARDEAERVLATNFTGKQLESTLTGIFNAADKDNSKFLSQDEFVQCLLETNVESLDEGAAIQIMQSCDTNGDGLISFEVGGQGTSGVGCLRGMLLLVSRMQ